MKVSLVVVCHHSSRVLSPCLESFRREATAAGVEAEVVAVEHSEDAAELASRLKAFGVDSRPYFLGMHEQPVLRQRGLLVGRGCGAGQR